MHYSDSRIFQMKLRIGRALKLITIINMYAASAVNVFLDTYLFECTCLMIIILELFMKCDFIFCYMLYN